jgi:hypothetical protein
MAPPPPTIAPLELGKGDSTGGQDEPWWGEPEGKGGK